MATTTREIVSIVTHAATPRWVWAIIVLVLVASVSWYLWSKFKKRKDNLLSTKIEEEIAKSCKPNRFFWVRELPDQFYFPSWVSVLTIFCGAVVLFLLSRLQLPQGYYQLSFLNFDNSSQYQNLIAIHAGIGGIIFALLIFVAESLRDDETKDRARVLLRESFLFPLTVAEIMGFFVFIWGNVNILSILSVFILAGLTIGSLWRLFSVLLNKAKFAAKRLALLKDRIRHSIRSAIKDRYGNNIFLSGLGENKIELQYYPFTLDADEQKDRYNFYADKNGVVVNIRLDKLDEFAKALEREANNNGFSFYTDKVKENISTSEVTTSAPTVPSSEKLAQRNRQYVHKRFLQEVDEDGLVLVSIDKTVLGENADAFVKKYAGLVKESFIIKNIENFSQELKLEIGGLKDQFIAAILEKKLGKIEELTRTYIGLAESFLEEINMCGGGYTYEQAKKERTTLMGGWNEIRWLTDDIFEIYKKSIESRDQEIFADVAYIPVGIAVRAIKKKDQYVYQEFLRFPGHLYWLATKVEAGEFRDFMVDRSWRHLKEMSDFYVEHEIKRKANSAEKITQYAEFTIPIFVAFQNLIKTAFDARDFESFSTFLDKFSQIYDDFDPQEEHINTEHFKLNLGWSTDDKQREDLKARLSIQEAKEAAVKDIFLKRQQVIFGLSAFIFDQVRNNPTNEGYRKFFDKVSNLLPRQLPELTSTYQTSRQFETEHFWDWDNWEMVPDGVVRSIDFHSKLDRLYAVKGLIILSGLTEDQVSSLVLPHSRDLAFQAENRAGNTNLYSLLNDISTHPDNWAFILPAAAIQKTSAFQALLLKAKEAQESEEEKFIESSGLDEEKLSEFKSKLFSTFDKAGTMRPLLKAMGVYTSQSAVPKEEKILSWGYNQIGEKAAFVKGWYVHYSGFGEEYGQGMASSEDQLIFQEIVSGLAEKNVTKENIVSEIKNVIDSQNIENPIILQTLDFQSVYSQIRQADIFLDHYNRDCPKNIATGMHGYLGVLKVGEKNIPIVQVFVRETALKNKIVVVDLDKFGVLNQYPPKEKSEDEKYVDGIFYLRVADLNVEDELRQKIISEKPAWLDEYADKDAYLRGKVLINVYQKFRFEIKNKKAGAYLSVGGPVPPDEDE